MKSKTHHFFMFIEDALVALTMFTDETFQQKYTPASLPINLLQASRLYFQVSLLLNPSSNDLGIVLENCYAESKSALSAQNVDAVQGVDFVRRTYFVKNR